MLLSSPGLRLVRLPRVVALWARVTGVTIQTVHNIRQEVLSLIELHMNVVSFEMNRVMCVLMVVSVLGLIPGG